MAAEQDLETATAFAEKRNSQKLTTVEITEQEQYEWQRLKALCAKTQTDMWEILHLAESAIHSDDWAHFYDAVSEQQSAERKKRASAD